MPSTTPSSSPPTTTTSTTTTPTTTTSTQSPPQTTTVEPETTPTQPPQTTQEPETTIEVTSTAEPTTQEVTTEEPTTVSQGVCTNCELPSTDPNNPEWTNYSASTCDGFDPNTASLYSPVILDNSTTEQCQKLIQCNFAEGEILYAIVTYVATNATWCVPLQLDSETAAFPLICNSSIGQYEDIFGWAIYHVIGCGNGASATTTEAPTTSTPTSDCEVPDEVCAILMIDQSIVLPILDYFNDPIALVQVFLTSGNCFNNSSEIEHGSTFTAACPIVSGAAGLFSSFFEMIGVQMFIQDYIDQAGFYVTTFQTAFNAIFSSVQAGVDGVTTQMCPEWISDEVTTTTASP
ncbi:hypothetical protein WR25_19796 [Diploscapter pachys]|uniref:Uncharacterized protein n=1 Tax=Diploscapter pachys TaxID=2018661 RepID=A0A2A2JDQ9_9BILA|nr:hypothetical protein WR25_19796 [Diploscapter pachys]